MYPTPSQKLVFQKKETTQNVLTYTCILSTLVCGGFTFYFAPTFITVRIFDREKLTIQIV